MILIDTWIWWLVGFVGSWISRRGSGLDDSDQFRFGRFSLGPDSKLGTFSDRCKCFLARRWLIFVEGIRATFSTFDGASPKSNFSLGD